MRVEFDDQAIVVTPLDSEDSIKKKVAQRLGTIPRFLKFGPFTLQGKRHDAVIRLRIKNLSKIIRRAKNKPDLERIYENKVKPNWDISQRTFALLFIYFNYVVDEDYEMPEDVDEEWLAIRRKVMNFDPDFFQLSLDIIQKHLLDVKDTIYNGKQQLNRELESFTKLSTDILRYEEVPHTPFELKKITIKVVYETSLNVIEFFNMIKVSRVVPFVALTGNFTRNEESTYYKVDKRLKPAKSWIDIAPSLGTIEMYVLNVKEVDTSATEVNTKKYSVAYLKIESYGDANRLYLELEFPVTSDVTEQDIIDRILGSIIDSGRHLKFLSQTEVRVNGVFYVPDFYLSKDIFLDMVTNDDLLIEFYYDNELEVLSTQKSRLYLRYLPLTDESVTVASTLTPKIVLPKEDPEVKHLDVSVFPPESDYLKVRINMAKDIDQAQEYIKVFTRMLNRYSEKFKSIVRAYERYIPTIKTQIKEKKKAAKKKTVKKKKAGFGDKFEKLRSAVPQLFVRGYYPRRACQRGPQPRILEGDDIPEQIEELEEKGHQVMEFPRKDDPVLTQRIPVHYYVCDMESKYPYPGLKVNKLEGHKDLYPYLPCCYAKNQVAPGKRSTLASYIKNYKSGQTVVKKKAKQGTYVIQSEKFVLPDRLGELPPNLAVLFSEFNIPEEYDAKDSCMGKFCRLGVVQSPSSLLHCLSKAFDQGYPRTVSKREAYIKNKRDRILTGVNPAIAKQELYDATPQQIADRAINPEIYLDPNEYFRILEERYNCNIFTFTKKTKNEGILVIPRHTYSYFKYKTQTNKSTVFIYYHSGSESDVSKFPQCELIARQRTEGIDTSFKGDIVKRITTAFMTLSHTMILQELRPPTYPRAYVLPFKQRITGQLIDSYGKTRILTFERLAIQTEPLPPLNVPALQEEAHYVANVQDVISFAQAEGIKFTRQDIRERKTVGLYAVFNSIKIYVAIAPTDPLPGIKKMTEKDYIPYVAKQVSDLEKRRVNRRIARYLQQYVLYVFSLWWHSNDFTDIHSDQIAPFLQEKVVIERGYPYDLRNIPMELNDDNSIYHHGKLYIASRDIMKRLMYNLYLAISYNKKQLFEYADKQYLDKYFVDISDFDKYSESEVIFIGNRSLRKWLEEDEIEDMRVIDFVPDGFGEMEEPLLFRSEVVNELFHLPKGSSFILQNVINGERERAITVCLLWSAPGVHINYGYTAPVSERSAETSFWSIILRGKGVDILQGMKSDPITGDSPKLLKYGDEGGGQYAALLPLNSETVTGITARLSEDGR